MFTSIIAWLSQGWFGQVIGFALNWWTTRQQNIQNALSAETQAEVDHQNDGAQSVADRESSALQNAALDKIQNELEHPTPVQITKPEVKP